MNRPAEQYTDVPVDLGSQSTLFSLEQKSAGVGQVQISLCPGVPSLSTKPSGLALPAFLGVWSRNRRGLVQRGLGQEVGSRSPHLHQGLLLSRTPWGGTAAQ